MRSFVCRIFAAATCVAASIHGAGAADQLPQFRDCAVLSYNQYLLLPGVGFFVDRGPSGGGPATFSSQSGVNGQGQTLPFLKQFTCIQHNTAPVTGTEVATALDAHVTSIDEKLERISTSTQQAIATSFAVQLDILSQELAEIRGILSSQPQDVVDAAVARLDRLEKRLEAMQPKEQ